MRIKLHPTGQELEVDPNKTLLQLCMDAKIEIKSICKGVPSCAECRVRILAGEHNLIPPNKAELNLIGTSYYIDGRRLACQVRAFGDISVDITEHLEKDENSTKKLRGYRPQPGRQQQSSAVQGTLVLQEASTPPSRGGGRGSGGAGNGGETVGEIMYNDDGSPIPVPTEPHSQLHENRGDGRGREGGDGKREPRERGGGGRRGRGGRGGRGGGNGNGHGGKRSGGSGGGAPKA